MFEVISTGKNENYGKKGERRLVANNYLTYLMKHGYIESKIVYKGYPNINRIYVIKRNEDSTND